MTSPQAMPEETRPHVRPLPRLSHAELHVVGLMALASAPERQVLEELVSFLLGGEIVDREDSQPSATLALATAGR